MRKIIFFLLLAFISVNCNVSKQSKKTTIVNESALQADFNKDATVFFKLFNDENWEGMTEMMYPKLFELATKEQMVSTLAKMSDNGMKMTVKDVKIYKVSDPITSGNEVFRKLSYTAEMKIKLSGMMLESVEMLEESFKKSFGEERVIFDKKTNTFLINSNKALIAISEKNKSNWKYLEFNESQSELLKRIFPDSVYQEFKSK